MAENREEILANFQGITAIEDVAEAIFHLDESNWDLLSAINRVMPQDGNNSAHSNDNDNQDVEMIDEDISVITPKPQPPEVEDNNQASTSSPRITDNMIVLQVHFSNRLHPIHMASSATVSDLKKRLELVCGVPLCRQQISGLGGSKAISTATLGSLDLAKNTVLRLKASDELMADDEVAERLISTYTLRVKCDDNKEYCLKFPGTKTVREVKNDIYALTDIPVRHQGWSGWPAVVGLEDTVLAMVGLNQPEHDLTLKRVTNGNREYKRIIIESSDSDLSSVEEVGDDNGEGFVPEDDMFVDVARSTRLQPLMPDNVEDEALGCIEFSQQFRARYGPHTPDFFEGTLQDAIKEACLKPAKERKLLGVYLHHEQSVLANVFCAQLLGAEAVRHTLRDHFLLFGWDMTSANNANLFLTSIGHALGAMAALTVRSIPVERLPALLIIMRVRSNTEIYCVINGNVGVSELVSSLVSSLERWRGAREEDARQEEERETRQREKREQDEAYQQSLQADRAKEEIRKQQELERTQEIQRAESERRIEEERKEALQASALSRVPSEPDATEPGVTRIRARLPPPHENCLDRRFRETDPLSALFDFLASKGFPQESYKVIASWPRRDLTNESHSSTLKELKLCPQETVMVEER